MVKKRGGGWIAVGIVLCLVGIIGIIYGIINMNDRRHQFDSFLSSLRFDESGVYLFYAGIGVLVIGITLIIIGAVLRSTSPTQTIDNSVLTNNMIGENTNSKQIQNICRKKDYLPFVLECVIFGYFLPTLLGDISELLGYMFGISYSNYGGNDFIISIDRLWTATILITYFISIIMSLKKGKMCLNKVVLIITICYVIYFLIFVVYFFSVTEIIRYILKLSMFIALIVSIIRANKESVSSTLQNTNSKNSLTSRDSYVFEKASEKSNETQENTTKINDIDTHSNNCMKNNFCANCGVKINDGGHFCVNCGSKIE